MGTGPRQLAGSPTACEQFGETAEALSLSAGPRPGAEGAAGSVWAQWGDILMQHVGRGPGGSQDQGLGPFVSGSSGSLTPGLLGMAARSGAGRLHPGSAGINPPVPPHRSPPSLTAQPGAINGVSVMAPWAASPSCWEGVQRMEPVSFRLCPVTGREVRGTN